MGYYDVLPTVYLALLSCKGLLLWLATPSLVAKLASLPATSTSTATCLASSATLPATAFTVKPLWGLRPLGWHRLACAFAFTFAATATT